MSIKNISKIFMQLVNHLSFCENPSKVVLMENVLDITEKLLENVGFYV